MRNTSQSKHSVILLNGHLARGASGGIAVPFSLFSNYTWIKQSSTQSSNQFSLLAIGPVAQTNTQVSANTAIVVQGTVF
jgi:hypothetical protein